MQIKGPVTQKKLGRSVTIRKNYLGLGTMSSESKIAKGLVLTKLGIIGIRIGIA